MTEQKALEPDCLTQRGPRGSQPLILPHAHVTCLEEEKKLTASPAEWIHASIKALHCLRAFALAALLPASSSAGSSLEASSKPSGLMAEATSFKRHP